MNKRSDAVNDAPTSPSTLWSQEAYLNQLITLASAKPTRRSKSGPTQKGCRRRRALGIVSSDVGYNIFWLGIHYLVTLCIIYWLSSQSIYAGGVAVGEECRLWSLYSLRCMMFPSEWGGGGGTAPWKLLGNYRPWFLRLSDPFIVIFDRSLFLGPRPLKIKHSQYKIQRCPHINEYAFHKKKCDSKHNIQSAAPITIHSYLKVTPF